MLLDHVGFWQAALADLLPHRRSEVRYTLFAPSALDDRIGDTIRPALDPRAVTELSSPSIRNAPEERATTRRPRSKSLRRTAARRSTWAMADSWTGPRNSSKTRKSAASSAVCRQPASRP